jgi:hypothetical protein
MERCEWADRCAVKTKSQDIFAFAPRCRGVRRRGTAMALSILVSTVLTGLVLAVSMTGGVQALNAGMSIHTDQANAVAESAGQVALWQFKTNTSWRQSTLPTPLPTLTMGNNTFSYALTCVDASAAATLYWPFNEGSGLTTADASGNGNTGTLNGGVTWTSAGHFGEGLLFDGSTGYVDAGNAPSTNIAGSATVAGWVKMNTAAQDQKVGGNEDNISGGYKLAIYGMRCEFETHDASNNWTCNRYVSGGTILMTGVWYHCCGVMNAQAGTMKTYVNGVLDRELDGVSNTALAATTGDLIIGREPWLQGGNTRYFNGTLDEIKVYNRALSDTEIRALADTTVHVHAVATLTSPAVANPPTNVVDFMVSSPTPQAPVAPAITVAGNLPLNQATISGNVQVTGNLTGVATSTVNGVVQYGGTYSDPLQTISITYKGKSATATKTSGLSNPTINYSSIQSQAIQTLVGGTGQNITFNYVAGNPNIIYVNGNVISPNINASAMAGTLLINGNLTLGSATTIGTALNPVNVIVEGNVTQLVDGVTIYGTLYVKGSWTHGAISMYGDVVVNGSVIDTSSGGSAYVCGPIPWFDARGSAAPTTLPIYYSDYEGAAP